MPSFTVQVLPKASFVGRLFGRVPREAAFVEIRNELAVTPWHDVRESDIASVLARHKVTSADVVDDLMTIYREAVTYAAADGALTDMERAGLARLRAAFDLTREHTDAVLEDVARQRYRELLVDALGDGHVSADERAKLDAIALSLGVDAPRAQTLYAEEARRAMQLYFDHCTQDKRFSPDEEQRLRQMSQALDIELTFSDAQLLERYRLFGRIETGELPVVDVPILLQRGERCHFFADQVVHSEIRTVTKRVNYSGVTTSVRIIKGVRWRVGSITPQRVTQDVLTRIDTGPLFMTNKRVLIQGAKKKTAIALTKIIHFTVFSDGLQLQKDTGRDVFVMADDVDWELAGACLDAAARNVR
jgi:tellurite resistance protein